MARKGVHIFIYVES